MKMFYCSKCKKFELDFQFDRFKQQDNIIWTNIRDGYGRPITHIICPSCGYILSGFIETQENCDKDEIEYLKFLITNYSQPNGYIIDFDKLIDNIFMRKRKEIEILKNRMETLESKLSIMKGLNE